MKEIKKKLECVLLVDDDTSCNFFHQILFDEMNLSETVSVATDGKQAIEYLKNVNKNENPRPSIIFLDINMPVMDGWEFLEEYEKLTPSQQAHIVLVMLTTSLNPDDQKKAENIDVVNDFHNKYLTEETVMKIIEEHFPENLK